MLAKTSTILCVVLGATLVTARAQADEPEPDSEKPAAPATPAAGAEGTDSLTLPHGRLLLNAFVEIGLSTGAAFKPISLSPDVWYGVTDDITVGLVHSAAGGSGFIGGVGDALCLTGTDNGCAELYPGLGIDARYKLKTGAFAWAADGGLYARHLGDPLELAVKLGALGRWHSGQLAVELEPNIFIGVTNRTVSQTVGGVTVDVGVNEDFLNLPVTVLYAVTPAIAVSAQVGALLPLESTGDAYSIPLSIGGHYRVNESLNVSLAFSLPRLVGGGDGTGFDTRSLTLGGTYAF